MKGYFVIFNYSGVRSQFVLAETEEEAIAKAEAKERQTAPIKYKLETSEFFAIEESDYDYIQQRRKPKFDFDL